MGTTRQCCTRINTTAGAVTDTARRTINAFAVFQYITRTTCHNFTCVCSILIDRTTHFCCIVRHITQTIAFADIGRTCLRQWILATGFFITAEFLAICTEMIFRTVNTRIAHLRECFITRCHIAIRTIRIPNCFKVTNILITCTILNIACNIIQIAFSYIGRIIFTRCSAV